MARALLGLGGVSVIVEQDLAHSSSSCRVVARSEPAYRSQSGEERALPRRAVLARLGGVTQAIFGLIGVLVGSLITWGIEVWRARRRDHDEARVAARLVVAELQTIENVRTVDEPQFRRERELALQQDAWISHRAALARELDNEEWQAVRDAYDALSDIPRSTRAEKYVDDKYDAAIAALRELASPERRYWWRRLRPSDRN